jgi:hypothetical protein
MDDRVGVTGRRNDPRNDQRHDASVNVLLDGLGMGKGFMES